MRPHARIWILPGNSRPRSVSMCHRVRVLQAVGDTGRDRRSFAAYASRAPGSVGEQRLERGSALGGGDALEFESAPEAKHFK